MTITELFPQLHRLSKSEKLTVIKFLVQELESESEQITTLPMSQFSYPHRIGKESLI